MSAAIDIYVRDAALDPIRDVVYASLAGGSVVSIDPKRAEVTGLVLENGYQLAIDPSGTYLYVGGMGIRRLDLATGLVDLTFGLDGPGSELIRGAREIEVMPGHPETIAVVSHEALLAAPMLAIYDDGVRRPLSLPWIGTIEFGANESTLYGYDDAEDSGFYRFAVDASGVTTIDRTEGLIPRTSRERGFGLEMRFGGGVLVTGTGLVIDPTVPAEIGRLDLLELPKLALDAGAGRVYAMVAPYLESHSLTSFEREQRVRVPLASSGLYSGLLRRAGGVVYWWDSYPLGVVGAMHFIDTPPCGSLPLGCNDGEPCNGVELCGPGDVCLPGEPVTCDDGDPCNGGETCDRQTGYCTGSGVPPIQCNDSDPCNGVERCEPFVGCISGTPIECDDGDACNGTEYCDPTLGDCVSGDAPTCTEHDGDLCTEPTCKGSIGCVEERSPDATCWDIVGTLTQTTRSPHRARQTTPFSGELLLKNDGTYRMSSGHCPESGEPWPAEMGLWRRRRTDRLVLEPTNVADIMIEAASCAATPAAVSPTRAVRRRVRVREARGRFCRWDKQPSDGNHLCGLFRSRGGGKGTAIKLIQRFSGSRRDVTGVASRPPREDISLVQQTCVARTVD